MQDKLQDFHGELPAAAFTLAEAWADFSIIRGVFELVLLRPGTFERLYIGASEDCLRWFRHADSVSRKQIAAKVRENPDIVLRILQRVPYGSMVAATNKQQRRFGYESRRLGRADTTLIDAYRYTSAENARLRRENTELKALLAALS